MDYHEIKERVKNVRFFNILVLNQDTLTKLSYDFMQENLPNDMLAPYIEKKTLLEFLNDEDELESFLGGKAEGVVYQKYDEYDIVTGHFLGVKHKYTDFVEKTKRQYSGNSIGKLKNYTPEELNVQQEAMDRITKQRLENVLSHGDIELVDKNIGLMIKAVLADIKNEMKKETSYDIDQYDKTINKLAGKVANVIREKLKEE